MTIRNGSGQVIDRVPATASGDRWVTSERLAAGQTATVEAGDVTDAFGDYNGAASSELSGGPAPADSEPVPAGEAGEAAGGDPAEAGADEEISAPPTSSACTNLIRGTGKGEVLRGTASGDRINGGGGDDKLRGAAGDDCLRGGGGRDVINCGPGNDYAAVTSRDRVRRCERVYLGSR